MFQNKQQISKTKSFGGIVSTYGKNIGKTIRKTSVSFT